jgi:FKBP-type peptidyl-prolyl cis-trans isomerase
VLKRSPVVTDKERFEVIVGLHDGVATMKLHEVSQFRISPQYAYGPLGLPTIVPEGTNVVFEVELCTLGQDVVQDAVPKRNPYIKESVRFA